MNPNYKFGCLMNCLEALDISADELAGAGSGRVVAVIGSGGKSTLLRTLGDAVVARGGRAVLATTTHFLPFEGMPLVTSDSMDDVRLALEGAGIVCAGQPTGDGSGKLAAPAMGLEKLADLADVLLVEADGSRHLPLKAHAAHEPVIPTRADVTACVVGASGFGGRLGAVMHRCELACERVGYSPDDAATPELVARMVADELARGLIAPDAIIVNQAETDERRHAAREFAAALREGGCDLPVLLGSVRGDTLEPA